MKKKIEDIFLLVSLMFGLISILIIPPFQTPDESSHFQRAYSISKGQLYYSIRDDKKGLYIEDELSKYVEEYDKLNGNISNKYSYSEMYFQQELPKLPTATTHKFFSTIETSFIAYIFSSVGIVVSKIFKHFVFHQSTTYLYSLYFARLFNLILYVGLMYFSIKKTPILKKTMFTIGLLPMSIMLSASCSYDGLIIGSSCFVFSNILSFFYQKHKFDYKYVILFIIFGFLLFFIKYAYILLLLLLLFIPLDRFKDKKDKIVKILIIFVGIIALYFIFNIPNYINTVSGEDALNGQISFILSNPFRYIKILFNSMYDKFGIQLSWILGGFGNLDTHFPGFIYFVMFVYLIILFLFDSSNEKSKFDFKFKIFCFLILFCIICLIYTALYLIWTPVGNEIIEGVQGRYFIPIIVFTPLLILENHISLKFKKINDFICNYYLYFSLMFLILYCILIVLRFWC